MFAAIFERKKGAFVSKFGLTPAQFGAENKRAAANGLALSSVDAYGTPGDIRYVGVWSADSGGAWYYTYGKSRQQHQAEYNAKRQKGFRPVKVAVAPDGTYSAVWRKDGLRSWAHFVDMNAMRLPEAGRRPQGQGPSPRAGQRRERQVHRRLALTRSPAWRLGIQPAPRVRHF